MPSPRKRDRDDDARARAIGEERDRVLIEDGLVEQLGEEALIAPLGDDVA
jgi:hypothetical protein